MSTDIRPRVPDASPPRGGYDDYPVRRRPAGPSFGRIMIGVLLIGVGLLWLLDATGAMVLQWRLVLPAALALVGIALLASARTGAHGGLVTIGVFLTAVVLVVGALPGLTVTGGVGDRTEAPATATDLETRYELGAGTLVVDLTTVEGLAEATEVVANVGMGELVVRLPDGVGAQVDARVGMGTITVPGDSRSGVSVGLSQQWPGEPTVLLDLSVGMGNVEVQQ